MPLLYVRNSIPKRYNAPLIDRATLQALVDEGLNQAEITKRIGRSQTTISKYIKMYGINYQRKPSKFKRAGNSKEKFRRNIKRNYSRATSWDLLGPGLLMEEGRLTKQGEIAWAAKVERAYGRRGEYCLNPVGYD